MGDAGQAAVASLGVVVVCVLLVAAVGRLATRTVDTAHAQAAADATALALVSGGVSLARDVAHRNGAELVDWSWSGADVVVEVSVGSVTARARATDQP